MRRMPGGEALECEKMEEAQLTLSKTAQKRE